MSANDPDWWRGAVFYQIYPRSFYDDNGDGIGDLKGITRKLDYIADLGVDAVWLSPFFTSPMVDFGYDVSDYQSVAPIFGTLDDFDEMLQGMHSRGLKLVIDLVLNHTSDQHPWFVESRQSRDNPKSSWYVWAEPKPDGTPPNNWLSVFGGPSWRYDTRRGQYYYHQFLRQQPDLNNRHPEVQDALLDVAKWWLDRGVDGFRLDAVNHCMHDRLLRDNPPRDDIDRSHSSGRQMHPYYWQRHLYDKTQPDIFPFLARLRKLVDQYPGRMMVAEIGDDNQVETSLAYTDGPEKLHTAYNFALLGPGVYDVKVFRKVIEEYISSATDAWPSWAFSNHDVVRVASRWCFDGQADARQAKMLLALLTSLRGTSFVYQGEELGLSEADIPFELLQDPFGIFLWPEDKGRDGCRTPFPWNGAQFQAGFSIAEKTWLPIPEEHMKASVTFQEEDPDSVLQFFKSYLRWRKQYPALIRGKLAFIDAPEPVLAFRRLHQDQSITCCFNFAQYDVAMPLPAGLPIGGHGLPYKIEGQSLILPPFGGFYCSG